MRLLVKNTQNSYLTGDVLVITEDGHSFGRWESKNVFLNTLKESESPLDWPNHFVIVNVPGVPAELYQYLIDELEDGQRHFYLEPQGPGSPYWGDLKDYGEVTINQSELEAVIRSRI